MKSSYEIAMERLNKVAPTKKMSDEQRKQIAEIDSKYAAKIAEREIFLKGEMSKAMASGQIEEIEKIEKQLVSDRKSLKAESEEKKEKIRGEIFQVLTPAQQQKADQMVSDFHAAMKDRLATLGDSLQ